MKVTVPYYSFLSDLTFDFLDSQMHQQMDMYGEEMDGMEGDMYGDEMMGDESQDGMEHHMGDSYGQEGSPGDMQEVPASLELSLGFNEL